MPSRKPSIGVIGGNETTPEIITLAFEIGSVIAARGAVLVCGGGGGCMEAACKGALEQGGVTIGIVPGIDKNEANPYVQIVIPSGLGIARNAVVVHSSDVLIALPGGYGTLSEIAIALAMGKTVVYLPGTWDLKKIGPVDSGLFKEAFDANQAIGFALNALLDKA